MGLSKTFLDPISETKPGKNNLITDVPGITVGHQTLKDDRLQTGVTVISPSEDNVFKQKMPAGVHVINGFGKSMGLVQVEELGTLETPIVLTNTLSAGTAYTTVVKKMLAENSDIGTDTGTVNPVILECNDGVINHIRDLGISEADVKQAFEKADTIFEEGAVGGGTGMCCYDLKGGIGSSSRQIAIDGTTYTMGALVMANYGFMQDLSIYDVTIGPRLKKWQEKEKHKENGSIVTVIATDIPFDTRQLKRIAKRSSVGINRTGAFGGNGSGEITVAFSTANRIAHYPENEIDRQQRITDEFIDRYFRMTTAVVEEAVLSCLVHAQTTDDRKGQKVWSLKDALQHLQKEQYDEKVAWLQEKLGI